MVASLIAFFPLLQTIIRMQGNNLFDVLLFLSFSPTNKLFLFLLEGALSLPLPPEFFLSELCVSTEGEIRLVQQLTFKAAVQQCAQFCPLFSDSLSVGFFF